MPPPPGATPAPPAAAKPAPLSWDLVRAIAAGRLAVALPEDFNGPGFAPADRTLHRPGSFGKVAVMAARYARRERLFHPKDARA